jgi:two-component system response regulator RegA
VSVEPPSDQLSILLVDDDETFRKILARSLRGRGYDVCVAAGYDEALARVVAETPHFAVVDLRMAGRSGLDLVEAIKRARAETAVIVLTADQSLATRAAARRLGASDYLAKPADTDDLIAALARVRAASERSPE